MRSLLVSVKSDKTRGGIAVWTEKYLSGCRERNLDCTLVNTEVRGKRGLYNEFLRTRRIFRDLKAALCSRYDVAHLNTSCGTFGLFRDLLIARCIQKRGIPLVTQYHCDIPHWIRSKLSRWCLGRLVKCSDENIVLCANSRQFLKEQYGADSLQIPNFVEEQLVRTDNKQIRPAMEHALFVGRVEQAKGAKEIFEAAKQLPHIRFKLVGSVCDAVSDWEKPDNVQLTGSVPNEQVIALLDEADVFLLPSYTEGCSVALLEAMARGVPCVATDVGANAQCLSGDCGVLIKPKSTEALVKALQVLENAVFRQKLSVNATEKIRLQFTSKNIDELLSTEMKVAERTSYCKKDVRR